MTADPSVKVSVCVTGSLGPRILNRRSHGSVTSTQQYQPGMSAVSTPTQVNMCGRAKCMEHVGETLG